MPNPTRCAVAARGRDDPPAATAPPARRLLLLEVPGPWGRTTLRDTRLDRVLAGRLADAAEVAGVRVQLLRRPARSHPDGTGAGEGEGDSAPPWWAALADVRAELVQWWRWHELRSLLEVDLRAPLDPDAARASGPQEVVLVCTHGRHDVCCALDGRPVARALADAGHDVWETTHLSGDRFAGNVLLLPRGEVFGRLDPGTAPRVVAEQRAGRLDLDHYRGRCGVPHVEQAALHHAMVQLGERRAGAVRVVSATGDGADVAWVVTLIHTPDGAPPRRYRLTLTATWSEPAELTCAASGPSRVRRFAAGSLVDAG